jgi:hypothetical protein
MAYLIGNVGVSVHTNQICFSAQLMKSAESSPSSPFSFKEFNTLINGIERLSDYGRRVSDAIAKQPCEFLIQEATMA